MARTVALNNRFFNECVVRDERAKLTALLKAIPRWEKLAATEVQKAEQDIDWDALSDLQREWHENHINDEHYLLHHTAERLYAGLAVSIMATLESILGMLCAEQGVKLGPKADWGDKRKAIQRKLRKKRLDTFVGIAAVTRVRLLGNCFKHNDGKQNQEWVKKYGGKLHDEIEYRNEDWKELVDSIERFLLAVVRELPAT
jgi:hypothetical protein